MSIFQKETNSVPEYSDGEERDCTRKHKKLKLIAGIVGSH